MNSRLLLVLPTCYISVERVFNAADDGILVVHKPVAAHTEDHNSARSAEQSICRLVACESRGAECAVIYLTGVGDVVILAVPVVRAFERAPRCPVRCAAYRSAVMAIPMFILLISAPLFSKSRSPSSACWREL